VPKGLNITYKPLDGDHGWATITWSEQDVGAGTGRLRLRSET
jgi:hypothetical protein